MLTSSSFSFSTDSYSPTVFHAIKSSMMSSPGGSDDTSQILQSAPDSVPDSTLLNISLSTFSRNCKGPSRTTMSNFLRWLETHRQHPSKLTPVWSDTILQWSQALRTLGFRESEIVSEVNKWKEVNGPFKSSNKRYTRYPPMPADIKRAFRDIQASPSKVRDRMGDSYRRLESMKEEMYDYSRPSEINHPSNFEGPPPKNYICNRCGKKGDLLVQCDTFERMLTPYRPPPSSLPD